MPRDSSPHLQPAAGERPLNLAFVFLDFGEGGAQRAALSCFEHLDRARFRPHLVCVRGDGALLGRAGALDVPTTRLDRMRSPLDLAAIPALAREFRRIEADIVHVPLYSRVSPYARLAARLARVPITVAHEHSRPAAPGRMRRLVDRLLVPGSWFLAVSEADRRALMRAGVRGDRIVRLPNGVDLERFAPRDRQEARAELGLPEDARIALVPARLHPQKRHVDLIDALARIEGDPAAEPLLVCCLGDGPLCAVLPALARSAGLGRRLRFLGQREAVERWLASADFVLLASGVEGHPLALLEAHAAGRPVLATDVGGVSEIVVDGVTGRLVPARSPGALARGILAMLGAPEEREAMGRAARERALRDFGAVDAARRLEAAYARFWSAAGRGEASR